MKLLAVTCVFCGSLLATFGFGSVYIAPEPMSLAVAGVGLLLLAMGLAVWMRR